MDLFAAEIGLDPAEVRRRNLFASDAFPFTTASGARLRLAATTSARSTSRSRPRATTALREEQARRRASGRPARARDRRQRVRRDHERARRARARRRRDHPGRRGGAPHRLLLARAGPRDDVRDDRRRPARPARRVGARDQGRHRRGRRRASGTYGSKSTQIGGVAARVAADVVVERARVLAAEHLEASADDVVLDADAGGFHVVGSPTPVLTWTELATRGCEADGRLAELRAEPRSSRPMRRRSRSAPTSPSSRSTPRPARSSSGASSPSTTPATSSTP